MTKTTEELKHAMYFELNQIAGTAKFDPFQSALEAYLEVLRLDAKREELRLTEAIHYNAVLSDAYAHQQGLTHAACASERDTWTELLESKSEVTRLTEANEQGFIAMNRLREECEELRNKLQAFEFANKSAGEFLQAARAKIKTQRISIGQLKNERDNAIYTAKVRESQRDGLEAQLQEDRKQLLELREQVSATVVQNRQENASGEELKRFAWLCMRRGHIQFDKNADGVVSSPCKECKWPIGFMVQL